jgi:hypothetical protein
MRPVAFEVSIPPLTKLADGRHHLSSVAAQPVNANHDDGVALACIVQECGEAGTLLPRRHARQLVAIDAGRLNARTRECIDLLVERLVSGADSGVSELGAGRGGSGVDSHMEIVSKVSEHVNMRQLF